MNSNNHVSGQTMKHVWKMTEQLQPLKARKDPMLAAIFGFCFGGIGLGIYFQSLLDFVLPVVIWLVVLILAAPTGELLAIMAPVFCAIYGYRRAVSSNAKLSPPATVTISTGRPAAYSDSRIPPVIGSVPAALPPIIELANLKSADVSSTEMKLNHAKDLLGKGHISQSEYESIRGRILSQI